MAYTQADIVAQVAADLTASGLSGASPVATGTDNVSWLLTTTQPGPGGPEQLVLTVNVGVPDGTGMASGVVTLHTSQTQVYATPVMECTFCQARSMAFSLIAWVKAL